MQKALAPDISTWPDDNPQLIGSQCAACAATTFPVQPRCPKCLHPFGRFEGKSAMEMGVDAIFAAVADAGVEWKDVQFATGGSWTVANPDAIVGMVGLTGIPFTYVFNACATAACADGIRLGDYDIGIAVGLDKHPRGAFTEDPALVGMPSWYAEKGQYLTTQFFGIAELRISSSGIGLRRNAFGFNA